MIAIASSLSRSSRNVVQSRFDVLRLMDAVRDEAAVELATALSGLSVKRIVAAGIPGASAYGLSRAVNGADSNPLYRIVGVFVLLRKLGMGRERALRILGWLREIVDQLWPETEPGEFGKTMEAAQDLDVKDDSLRLRASHGCVESARRLLEVKREQLAFVPIELSALRRRIAEG